MWEECVVHSVKCAKNTFWSLSWKGRHGDTSRYLASFIVWSYCLEELGLPTPIWHGEVSKLRAKAESSAQGSCFLGCSLEVKKTKEHHRCVYLKRTKGETRPLISLTLWHYCVEPLCPVTSWGALTGRRHFRFPGEGQLSCAPLSLPPRNSHTKSSQNQDSCGIAWGRDVVQLSGQVWCWNR